LKDEGNDMERNEHHQGWEHCEIVYEITNKGFLFSNFGMKFRFWAQGFTSQDNYTVAVSDVELSGAPLSNLNNYHKYFRAVEDLERTLLIDGWEPLLRGGHWYSRKYRRRIQT